MGYRSFTSNLKFTPRHGSEDEMRFLIDSCNVAYDRDYVVWDEESQEFVSPDELRKQYRALEFMELVAESLKVGSFIELTGEGGWVKRVYIGFHPETRQHIPLQITPKIMWPRSSWQLENWDDIHCNCKEKVPF